MRVIEEVRSDPNEKIGWLSNVLLCWVVMNVYIRARVYASHKGGKFCGGRGGGETFGATLP